jgi:hypothetical protein
LQLLCKTREKDFFYAEEVVGAEVDADVPDALIVYWRKSIKV